MSSKRRPTITPAMKLAVLAHRRVLVECAACCFEFWLSEIQFDHHLALVDGGEHSVENLRPLCPKCHKIKSAHEHKENCRAKRRAKKHSGQHVSKRPMPKSNRPIPKRNDPWGTQYRKTREQ